MKYYSRIFIQRGIYMQHLFKRSLPFVALFLVSCSSSQFTFYKPDRNDAAWKAIVEQKAIPTNFVCKINDTVVVEESFGFFSNSFEKDGQFHGKTVIMSGFKKAHTVYKGKGDSTTEESYQIRVFIEGEEVEKFDF